MPCTGAGETERADLVERTCFRVLIWGRGPGRLSPPRARFCPAGTSGRYGYYNIADSFDAIGKCLFYFVLRLYEWHFGNADGERTAWYTRAERAAAKRGGLC